MMQQMFGGGGGGPGFFQDMFSVGGLAGFGGKQKSTGSVKAALKALAAQEYAFRQALDQQKRQVEQFLGLAPQLAQSVQDTSMVNPVYAGLQEQVVAGLRNQGQSPALSAAFEGKIREQLAARGVLFSPRSALSQSFSVLQFNEQMRQQSIQNAAGFLGLRSPTAIGGMGEFAVQPGFGMQAAIPDATSIYGISVSQSNNAMANYANAAGRFGSGLDTYIQNLQSGGSGVAPPPQTVGG